MHHFVYFTFCMKVKMKQCDLPFFHIADRNPAAFQISSFVDRFFNIKIECTVLIGKFDLLCGHRGKFVFIPDLDMTQGCITA